MLNSDHDGHYRWSTYGQPLRMSPCPCCRRRVHVWLLLLFTVAFISGQLPAWKAPKGHTPNRKLRVDTKSSVYNCSRRFLSVGLPHFHSKWEGYNLSSKAIISLASALGPTSVRIYGTPLMSNRDIQNYKKESRRLMTGEEELEMDKAQLVYHDPDKLLLSAENWNNVVQFVRSVGWDLMMDFTAFFHNGGLWVSKFARSFLDRASARRIKIPDFQLGNEPNLYDPDFRINASTVANDFRQFRLLLRNKYTFYKSSKIIGPDVTRFTGSRKFFAAFLQANGCRFVDEVSFHHYYYREVITLSTYLDIDKLDHFDEEISIGRSLMEEYNCSKPFRLTETSNSVGGGTPRLSDTFVAGFSWMDKLGRAALHGITQVFRHTFFASHYALISPNLVPNPDYYLSLMFKRYVEGPVFTIKGKLPRHIRAYANCARRYPPGSLVIYLMNLSDKNEYINFTQFSKETLSVYTFTAHKGDLQSRKVVMNGEPLEMTGYSLPVLKESRSLGDDIQMPPYSYAFVIATHTKRAACVRYFQEVKKKTKKPKVRKPTTRPAAVSSTKAASAAATTATTTTTTTASSTTTTTTATSVKLTRATPVVKTEIPDVSASHSVPRGQHTAEASASTHVPAATTKRAASDGRGTASGRGTAGGRGTTGGRGTSPSPGSTVSLPDSTDTMESETWETTSSSTLSTSDEIVKSTSQPRVTEDYDDYYDSSDNPGNTSAPVTWSYPVFVLNAMLFVLLCTYFDDVMWL